MRQKGEECFTLGLGAQSWVPLAMPLEEESDFTSHFHTISPLAVGEVRTDEREMFLGYGSDMRSWEWR